MSKIEKIALETPGRQAHRGHRRAVDPAERQRAELRRDVSSCSTTSTSAGRPELSGDADRRPAAKALARRGSAKAVGQRLRRAAGGRPGHRRRLQDHGRGPRRRRPRTPCKKRPTTVVAKANRRPGLVQGLFTSFRANTPWLYLDIDRDPSQDDGRVDDRDLQRHAAGLSRLAITSTTSTASAAPGRSTCRPTPTSASRSTISSSSRSATTRATWCPLGRAGRPCATSAGRCW